MDVFRDNSFLVYFKIVNHSKEIFISYGLHFKILQYWQKIMILHLSTSCVDYSLQMSAQDTQRLFVRQTYIKIKRKISVCFLLKLWKDTFWHVFISKKPYPAFLKWKCFCLQISKTSHTFLWIIFPWKRHFLMAK